MFTQNLESLPGPQDLQRPHTGTKNRALAIILSAIFILFASLTPGAIPTRMSEKVAGRQWNVSPADWLRQGVDVILNRTLTQAGDGAIILLHDGGGDRSQTVAALPFIIEGLQQRGFQLVTLQQLIDDMPGKHVLPRHRQLTV